MANLDNFKTNDNIKPINDQAHGQMTQSVQNYLKLCSQPSMTASESIDNFSCHVKIPNPSATHPCLSILNQGIPQCTAQFRNSKKNSKNQYFLERDNIDTHIRFKNSCQTKVSIYNQPHKLSDIKPRNPNQTYKFISLILNSKSKDST